MDRECTPTFPVGIEVVLAISRMISTTRIASCNILFPAPPKFILGNPSPPRSNLVVVGIFPSVLRLMRTNFEPHHSQSWIRKKGPLDFLADPRSLAVSNGPIFHKSPVRSPHPSNLTTISCSLFS